MSATARLHVLEETGHGSSAETSLPEIWPDVVAGVTRLTSFLDDLDAITDRPRCIDLGLLDAA